MAQRAMAPPLCSGGMRSDIVPAPNVKTAAPNIPAKNLKPTSMAIESATAHAIRKIKNPTLQRWYTGTRPYISESGAKSTTKQSAQPGVSSAWPSCAYVVRMRIQGRTQRRQTWLSFCLGSRRPSGFAERQAQTWTRPAESPGW